MDADSRRGAPLVPLLVVVLVLEGTGEGVWRALVLRVPFPFPPPPGRPLLACRLIGWCVHGLWI